jgi:uncharacterized protein YjdB
MIAYKGFIVAALLATTFGVGTPASAQMTRGQKVQTPCHQGQVYVRGYASDGRFLNGCAPAASNIAVSASPMQPEAFIGARPRRHTHTHLDIPAPLVPFLHPDDGAYSVCYAADVQNIGWQPFTCDWGVAGTTGQSLRMEALEIHMYTPNNQYLHVCARAHVQNIGWQPMQCTDYGPQQQNDTLVVGTWGQSLRMEALNVTVTGGVGIGMRGHVQNIGWQQEVYGNNVTIGTTGQSLRLEAVQMQLL